MKQNKSNRYSDRFRILSQKISNPVSSWKIEDAVLKIYRGKGLYQPSWADEISENLVLAARRFANAPYGRPLRDHYDMKSAVYIGSATYPLLIGKEYFFVEEWLSVRLVPGNSNPKGTGELEIYTCRGENVEDLVKKRFFKGNSRFLNHVAASNRMCGLRPYLKNKADENKTAADLLPRKIRHTAVLYALINKHFIDDYLFCLGGKYITGVIIDQLVDRALKVCIDGKLYGVCFTDAHEFLEVAPREVRLIRSANRNYAYHYPTYFLKLPELLNWLNLLIERGILSLESLRYYLKKEISAKDLEGELHVDLERFRNLGRIFTVRGQIYGSKITGDDLRRLADSEVSDGPKLRITSLDDLKKSIDVFLDAAKIV